MMISYPVSVPMKSYRGSDARKRSKVSELNRLAQRVEEYLNTDLAAKPDDTIHVYSSYSVASDIGADFETVRDIIFSLDCGSNGVTIFKGDYDRAMENHKNS